MVLAFTPDDESRTELSMRRLQLFELWYASFALAHSDGDAVSCRPMTRFAALARRASANALDVALYEDKAWTDAAVAADNWRRAAIVLGCAAHGGLATLDTWDGFVAAGAAASLPQKIYHGGRPTGRGDALTAKLTAATLETGRK